MELAAIYGDVSLIRIASLLFFGELQRVPHLLARVDTLKNNGDLSVESMEAGSEEYNDYLQMTS